SRRGSVDRAHRALIPPKKWEVEMLRSMKSSASEEDKSAAEVMVVQPHEQARATIKLGTASCIGSGMSIVGNVECDGPAQVFGRIKGELPSPNLLIGHSPPSPGT